MEQQVAFVPAAPQPYPLRLEVDYQEKLSRLTTFFRLILLIPHFIVLYFVGLVAAVFTFLAWFAILFTGKYPKGLFDFVAGALRWTTRVSGYSYLLTDKHPPYALK